MISSMLPAARSRDLVVALHCSGSSAAQWRALDARLGSAFAFAAPEHYDSGNAPAWTGGDTFTCADEAERTLALIDAADGRIHLIGHSYGGGVALHVALARPERIASLTLYEPSAFYLLKQLDSGAAPLAEITSVADTVAAAFVPATGGRPRRALSITGAGRAPGMGSGRRCRMRLFAGCPRCRSSSARCSTSRRTGARSRIFPRLSLSFAASTRRRPPA